ncbi:hypothetical protein CEXT_185671 [Caerostris extrusa]|uniref:Ribosomal protein S4 n=1 Tax=Caerostris extrusa TaxID=172846 RepID=A0AAV4UA49_CAEEX|nr:hypothetical protein CEXT_185671 [Caerostris extrusa]
MKPLTPPKSGQKMTTTKMLFRNPYILRKRKAEGTALLELEFRAKVFRRQRRWNRNSQVTRLSAMKISGLVKGNRRICYGVPRWF